jgi:lipopolysaccharide export system protein LptA
MRLILLAASFILTFGWITVALGQEGNGAATPIQVEADRMESSQENNAVLFFGNVKANQDNLSIQADEMTVLYTRTPSGPGAAAESAADLGQKIDKITAKGHVKIVQGDWVAAGETMDFNADARIVILAGNATAWQEQNMVSGEKIVLYLNEGRSVVESSSQAGEGERVKAFIYPSSQATKELNRPQDK